MAGAQEKLEATRRALDKRREELRGLERQARSNILSGSMQHMNLLANWSHVQAV